MHGSGCWCTFTLDVACTQLYTSANIRMLEAGCCALLLVIKHGNHYERKCPNIPSVISDGTNTLYCNCLPRLVL